MNVTVVKTGSQVVTKETSKAALKIGSMEIAKKSTSTVVTKVVANRLAKFGTPALLQV